MDKSQSIPAQLRAVAINWRDLSNRQRAAILDVILTTAEANRQLIQATTRPGQAIIDLAQFRKFLAQ